MSSDSEAAVIESLVRSRLSVIQDSSATVVSACAAWIGVYSAIAPAVITRVWASLISDASSTDTDQRIGLLAVMHESLKNCARRGGSDDVIRKYLLSVQRDVPNAITTAVEIEKKNSAKNDEFAKAALQALTLWRNFVGFFPSRWLEKTIASLTALTANNNNDSNSTGALVAGEDSALVANNNNNQQQANASSKTSSTTTTTTTSGGSNLAAAAGIDALAAESSGLAEILRLFQKYNASLERLRRYEADPSKAASDLEHARDEVVHRAKPLLGKLGSSGGVSGFVPSIEGEVRRLSVQLQQQTVVPEDAADPLEDFF